MPRLQAGAMITSARIVDTVTLRAGYGSFRIDTGDDIVIVDPSIMRTIGAQPVGSTDVEGIGAHPLPVPIYHVDIDLGSMGYLVDVEAYGLNIASLGYSGLIGDNALDQGVLIRNGPARSYSFNASGTYLPAKSPAGPAIAIAAAGLLASGLAALWPRKRP